MPNDPFTYDAVPYPSYTFPQTRPDRLSTAGMLRGVDTAVADNCRVLEIGCGDGTNLISFAYGLPQSRFVGVDLSKVHISKGSALAKRLSLTNIELLQVDVSNVGRKELGEFDFIIAHGLFSWVPEPVREHVLRIYEECLAPNGVGYISYNAYPGCHLREMSFGIMRFQADNFDDPREKVDQAIACLKLVGAAVEKGTVYQTILDLELKQILERSEQNVFHDDLSPVNQPFYFHEFDAMLGKIGMQFLAESDPSASNIGRFEGRTRDALASMTGNIRQQEQFIDLITCRRFRSTLFCRSEIEINRDPSPDMIRAFFLSSALFSDAETSKIKDDSSVRFTGPKDAAVEINHPLTKAALTYLGLSAAKGIVFSDLVKKAAAEFEIDNISNDDVARTETYFLQMYFAGFVHFLRYQPDVAASAGTRPAASHFSRWQIENGSKFITTLTGANLSPENDVSRALISLLDGTRNRDELVSAMKELIEVSKSERARFESRLEEMIETELDKFAKAGLLVS